MQQCPAWVAEYEKLRALVEAKYCAYVALTGVKVEQFQEGEGTKVSLLIGNTAIVIGHGKSLHEALTVALRTLETDDEFRYASPYFSIRLATADEVSEATRIMDECSFKK